MLRIRRAGGRVILDPAIKVHYTPRGSYRGVFRQYFQYGLWKVPVMLKHRQVLSARSLAPIAFLASLAVLVPAAAVTPVAGVVLATELAAYATGGLVFGTRSLRAHGEPLRLLPHIARRLPDIPRRIRAGNASRMVTGRPAGLTALAQDAATRRAHDERPDRDRRRRSRRPGRRARGRSARDRVRVFAWRRRPGRRLRGRSRASDPPRQQRARARDRRGAAALGPPSPAGPTAAPSQELRSRSSTASLRSSHTTMS